jgi:nitronate monooxygenase
VVTNSLWKAVKPE